jgi:dephospho-CoA kinase
MIILGLTGSIAMGKTETAKMFQRLGIPVYSADEAVHELYAKSGAAVNPIGALYPDVIVNGEVNREKLSLEILANPDVVGNIEKIVHPMVQQKQIEFITASKRSGAFLIVLDIPLLFETGGDKRVDKTVVVSAPADVQKSRALKRPGMTLEKLDLILSRQIPDEKKRAKADYIVETDKGLEHAFQQVNAVVKDLTAANDKI